MNQAEVCCGGMKVWSFVHLILNILFFWLPMDLFLKQPQVNIAWVLKVSVQIPNYVIYKI